MGDDMFFSPDSRSLRRGRRIARRTPTCRPCLVWPADAPEIELQGVVLDINPFGMLVRMLEVVPQGTDVRIQLMRGEDFQEALSKPVDARIVRQEPVRGLFHDHGVRIAQSDIPHATEPRPAPSGKHPQQPARLAPRMHTLDITVGDTGIRRTGR